MLKSNLIIKVITLVLIMSAIFVFGLLFFYKQNAAKTISVINSQRELLVHNFETILSLKSIILKNYVSDYSLWNDMAKDANNHKDAWTKVNVDPTLATFKLTHVWIFNKGGKQTYYAKLEESKELSLQELTSPAKIKKLFSDSYIINFFVQTPDNKIYEIWGSLIQREDDTDRTSEPLGYLFIAKLWDENYISELNKLMLGSVSIIDTESKCFSDQKDLSKILFSKPIYGSDKKALSHLCVSVEFKLITQLNEYAKSEIEYFIYFAVLFLVALVSLLIFFVLYPLKEISKALLIGNSTPLSKLKFKSNEFGSLARLVINYQDSIKEKASMQAQLYQAGKMASLGTLGAGIAHELNNPLTAVLGYADIIHETIKNDSLKSDKIKQQVAAIITQAERMRVIINHIREFSRAETGDKWKDENINNIIGNTLILMRQQILNNGIELIENLDPKLPLVLCDQVKLESVIQNLLINARDAIKDLANSRRGRIEISTKFLTETKSISISIKDNGTGLSQKVQEHIFEPFVTTKPVGSGTGLGLSLVFGIIKEHGGDITFNTDADKGTEFTILLPLKQEMKHG